MFRAKTTFLDIPRSESAPKPCATWSFQHFFGAYFLVPHQPESRSGSGFPAGLAKNTIIQSRAMNTKFIEDLNARIVTFLQQTPVGDVQKNLKAMLSSSFAHLDLVTREEFDLQAEVLKRTRENLRALEARVAALEAQR
jgi:BMFP domain-containing protein YqiC